MIILFFFSESILAFLASLLSEIVLILNILSRPEIEN